jgi:3-oxoacyl-[acyl-carrier protein] reductase
MDLELKDKVAVITGCSVGIGREVAKMLAAEGAKTVIVARRGELLGTLQEEIAAAGHARPVAVQADLYDKASASKIYGEAVAAFGRVDILVNNAGGSRSLPWDSPDDAWDESFALNFSAARRLTKAVLPGMIERRWGRVICLTGTSEPGGAAKAATRAWAKGLANELGKFGITVNCLAPGRIHSEQIDTRLHPTPESVANFAKGIPVGYFGEPYDMAYLIAFLCSPKARYITGERVHVDGGLHRGV